MRPKFWLIQKQFHESRFTPLSSVQACINWNYVITDSVMRMALDSVKITIVASLTFSRLTALLQARARTTNQPFYSRHWLDLFSSVLLSQFCIVTSFGSQHCAHYLRTDCNDLYRAVRPPVRPFDYKRKYARPDRFPSPTAVVVAATAVPHPDTTGRLCYWERTPLIEGLTDRH